MDVDLVSHTDKFAQEGNDSDRILTRKRIFCHHLGQVLASRSTKPAVRFPYRCKRLLRRNKANSMALTKRETATRMGWSKDTDFTGPSLSSLESPPRGIVSNLIGQRGNHLRDNVGRYGGWGGGCVGVFVQVGRRIQRLNFSRDRLGFCLVGRSWQSGGECHWRDRWRRGRQKTSW